jgi:hypothetical protein
MADIQAVRVASDNYFAFVIYSNIASTDFRKFNSDNATSNFPPLQGYPVSIGYGFSSKKNRRIFDINLTAFGVNKKTKKTGESIKTSFSTFLQFEWGYDFIKNKTLNIYPYAGVGLRSSYIEYKSPAQTNTSFTNITSVIQNNRSVNGSASETSYQAGVGMDISLAKPYDSGGIMFFIKAGTNMAFSRKKFDLEGVNYDPAFNYGDWIITAGFKIFGR